MSLPEEVKWNVKFVGDYFALTMWLTASDEDQAIANATALLQDHYGWDMEMCANEIEAQPAD
jgi:hypothetical protein